MGTYTVEQFATKLETAVESVIRNTTLTWQESGQRYAFNFNAPDSPSLWWIPNSLDIDAGVARFKADRGLVGGSSLGGSTALAYARALDGGEVLFRVERDEEAALRPADKACLHYLRAFARSRGAEAMGRLKESLDLGNPPLGPDAAALARWRSRVDEAPA